jgi:hypothetical protein
MILKYITISIVCALSSVIVQIWVRDCFYDNHIREFGILGSLPNFLCTFGSIMFVLGINKFKDRKIRLILLTLIIANLYREFESWGSTQSGNGNVFDWNDIIATLVGGMTGLLVYIKSKRV